MATVTQTAKLAASKTVYLVYIDEDGQLWDFTAEQWRSLATAANYSKAMAADGTQTAWYQTTIDLATINTTGTTKHVTVLYVEQLGGSPAFNTDRVFASEPLPIQFGQKQDKLVAVVADIVVDGSGVEILAWLEEDGELVDLDTIDSSATCDCELWEHDAGTYVLQVDDADHADFALSANSTNKFELTKASGITSNLDDSAGWLKVTITVNSVAHVKHIPTPIFGGGS